MPAKIMLARMLAWHSRRACQPTTAVAKREDPVGDAGRVHDVAHQDEQRRGEQRERIRRLRDLLRHDRRRQAAERDEGEGREPHRGEQRQPPSMRDAARPRTISQHQGGHSTAPPFSGDDVARPRAMLDDLGERLQRAVTAPARTIGTYIQASEIGTRRRFEVEVPLDQADAVRPEPTPKTSSASLDGDLARRCHAASAAGPGRTGCGYGCAGGSRASSRTPPARPSGSATVHRSRSADR